MNEFDGAVVRLGEALRVGARPEGTLMWLVLVRRHLEKALSLVDEEIGRVADHMASG